MKNRNSKQSGELPQDDVETLDYHWPEIHAAGIDKGWRGVASAAWRIRGDIAQRAASVPAQAGQEPAPEAETFGLYKAVNELMAQIGMDGQIDSDHENVNSVMNALCSLDGGNVAHRVEDLVEKAFMPRDQATRLAVDEFIAISEGAVPPIVAPMADKTVASVCGVDYIMVRRSAVDLLKVLNPALCIKSGLCERIGGRLYTRTCGGWNEVAAPVPAASVQPDDDNAKDAQRDLMHIAAYLGQVQAPATMINRLTSVMNFIGPTRAQTVQPDIGRDAALVEQAINRLIKAWAKCNANDWDTQQERVAAKADLLAKFATQAAPSDAGRDAALVEGSVFLPAKAVKAMAATYNSSVEVFISEVRRLGGEVSMTLAPQAAPEVASVPDAGDYPYGWVLVTPLHTHFETGKLNPYKDDMGAFPLYTRPAPAVLTDAGITASPAVLSDEQIEVLAAKYLTTRHEQFGAVVDGHRPFARAVLAAAEKGGAT